MDKVDIVLILWLGVLSLITYAHEQGLKRMGAYINFIMDAFRQAIGLENKGENNG